MKFLEKRENSLWGRLRQGLRPRSHTGPVKFEDRYLKEGWTLARGSNMLSHMRQMRAWVVAHAPKNSKDLQRIQEVHVLNQEIWYSVYRSEPLPHPLQDSGNRPSYSPSSSLSPGSS